MKFLLVLVLATFLAPAGVAETVACAVNLDIADQDPAGLNVRASPGGPIIAKLRAQGRWVEVDVTGQDGGWARIDTATLQADENDNNVGKVIWKGTGWVAFSKLEVDEFDSRARFYAAPDDQSKLVLSLESITDGSTVDPEAVLGCDRDWLKVRIKGIVGWTHIWCANQLTTCV